MDLRPKVSSIPALKDQTGQWIMEPNSKSNLIGEAFGTKYKLIDAENNKYADLFDDARVQDAPLLQCHTLSKQLPPRHVGSPHEDSPGCQVAFSLDSQILPNWD